MYPSGLIVYLLACFAAFALARRPLSQRTTTVGMAVFVLLVAAPLLWMWVAKTGLRFFDSYRATQGTVVLLHGMLIALLPSGILRPFSPHRWVPGLALALAILLPHLNLQLVQLFGDARSSHSSGIGSLSDLLFLDPISLGEGITREGVVPHRYRVHHLALLGLVFASFLLHFLPVRRAKLSDTADPDRPR